MFGLRGVLYMYNDVCSHRQISSSISRQDPIAGTYRLSTYFSCLLYIPTSSPTMIHDSAEAGPSRLVLPAAPRVSQIDADSLDEGLVHMLAEKVERSLVNFQVRPHSLIPLVLIV